MTFTDEQIRAAWPMPTFRKGQFEGLRAMVDALERKPRVLLEAPCGTGKSAYAVALGRLYENAFLSTPLVSLVSQMMADDYLRPHFARLVGKRNYDCTRDPGVNCSEGICGMIAYMHRRECQDCHLGGACADAPDPCRWGGIAEEALATPIMLSTLSLLVVLRDRAVEQERELLVIDEAHKIEDALTSDHTVTIPQEFRPYPLTGTAEEYLAWARAELEVLSEDVIDGLKEDAVKGGARSKAAKELRRTLSVVEGLTKLVAHPDYAWVPITEDRLVMGRPYRALKLVPAAVRPMIRDCILPLAKRIVFMSATPPTATELGLAAEDVESVVVPSTFPVENRPFIVDAVGKMGYKDREANVGKVAKRIQQIAEGGAKTLVHNSSYYVAKRVAEELRALNVPHILQDREDRIGSLETWRKSAIPVYLAINMNDGIDLPDDACRFVVFANCPYPDRSDPVIAKRIELEGDAWYLAKTMRSVVQGSARATRSETDFSMAWMLDSNFAVLWARGKDTAPAWFREAVAVKRFSVAKAQTGTKSAKEARAKAIPDRRKPQP